MNSLIVSLEKWNWREGGVWGGEALSLVWNVIRPFPPTPQGVAVRDQFDRKCLISSPGRFSLALEVGRYAWTAPV